VVTNVSQVVTVSRSIAKIQVNIYNAAGEVIKHLYAWADDPGNSPLGEVTLSNNTLSPEAGTPTAGGNASVTVYFNGTQVVWDGTSDTGAMVTNGVYQVEVNWTDGKGGQEVVSKGVIVNRGSHPMGDGVVWAGPNVLDGGATSTTIGINTPLAYTLTARLYDLAGELVKPAATGDAGSRSVTVDVTNLASGIYLVAVDITDSNGKFIQKQVTKLLIKK
jgi:flagellar hook assembly protein FlgD